MHAGPSNGICRSAAEYSAEHCIRATDWLGGRIGVRWQCRASPKAVLKQIPRKPQDATATKRARDRPMRALSSISISHLLRILSVLLGVTHAMLRQDFVDSWYCENNAGDFSAHAPPRLRLRHQDPPLPHRDTHFGTDCSQRPRHTRDPMACLLSSEDESQCP